MGGTIEKEPRKGRISAENKYNITTTFDVMSNAFPLPGFIL